MNGQFIARILLSDLRADRDVRRPLRRLHLPAIDSNAPRWVTAIVAIIWGVGGVGVLVFRCNWFVERLGDRWRSRLQPFVFVGPAVGIRSGTWRCPPSARFSASPLLQRQGVRVKNYLAVFSLQPNNPMMVAFRNNIMWIIGGATGAVILGSLVVVVIRSRFDKLPRR